MLEKNITQKLKSRFTKDNFLIVILVGVLLLVIVWPVEEKDGTQSVQWYSEDDRMSLQSDTGNGMSRQDEDGGTAGMLSYTAELEKSLEELLSTMDGVGKVKVMVTLEGSGEAVVEKDESTVRNGSTEVDAAGGSRNTTNISGSAQTVYRSDQGSGDIPYVKKVLSPRVEGVVVSAQGAGNTKIVRNITEAIQALFGIEAHKIKIVKMIPQ